GRPPRRTAPEDLRLPEHPLGHGLRLVGLAAVADRRVQEPADPGVAAGAVRLSAAHEAREAPHPRRERGPPLRGEGPREALHAAPLALVQQEQGGMRAGRSLRWWGPQTRRDFFAMLAWGERRG